MIYLFDCQLNTNLNLGIVPRICLSTQTIEIGDDEECLNSFVIELKIKKYDYFEIVRFFNQILNVCKM